MSAQGEADGPSQLQSLQWGAEASAEASVEAASQPLPIPASFPAFPQVLAREHPLIHFCLLISIPESASRKPNLLEKEQSTTQGLLATCDRYKIPDNALRE